jgi:hypothetical protein
MNKVIRPATADDISFFNKETGNPSPTVKAWVGELDGERVAIWGIARAEGRWIAFCDLREEARPFKKDIVRSGKEVMDEIRRMGLKQVYAIRDESEPMAKKWLKSLGFREHRNGMMQWREWQQSD